MFTKSFEKIARAVDAFNKKLLAHKIRHAPAMALKGAGIGAAYSAINSIAMSHEDTPFTDKLKSAAKGALLGSIASPIMVAASLIPYRRKAVQRILKAQIDYRKARTQQSSKMNDILRQIHKAGHGTIKVPNRAKQKEDFLMAQRRLIRAEHAPEQRRQLLGTVGGLAATIAVAKHMQKEE